MKTPLLRAWILGGLILFMDQWTKGLVVAHLELGEQREWVEGFFRLVYWGNTGAAWSMFRGNNYLLAGVAMVALLLLHGVRNQFDVHLLKGQVALGLMFARPELESRRILRILRELVQFSLCQHVVIHTPVLQWAFQTPDTWRKMR